MRALFVIAAFLLSGCTGITQVQGRYAGGLSPADIREIRHLVAPRPYFGHRLITMRVIRKDRVRVETREYTESGSDCHIQYVDRRHGRWYIDERVPDQWITERIVVTS
jgi:hypothetical protein